MYEIIIYYIYKDFIKHRKDVGDMVDATQANVVFTDMRTQKATIRLAINSQVCNQLLPPCPTHVGHGG